MSAATEATTINAPYDPWQAAENPTVRNHQVFGHCTADTWPCVLEKGSRPIHFDPSQHSVDQRRTRVEISIQPLSGGKYNDPIRRELIVESNEWVKVTLPSLRALGIAPRDISGKYVQCEMIPTRDYIKRDGTPGQATTPKFVAIFPDEAACRAASDALYGRSENNNVSASTSGAAQPAVGMSQEGQKSLLTALWTASGGNSQQFSVLLNATPQFKHLTLDSDEVKAVTGTF